MTPPTGIGELQLIADFSEIGWLPVVSHDEPYTRAFVPTGYECCVRILDALYSRSSERDLGWDDIRPDTVGRSLVEGIETVLRRHDAPGVKAEYVPERMRQATLQSLEASICTSNEVGNQLPCFYALWSEDSVFAQPAVDCVFNISSIRSCYLYQGRFAGWRSLWPNILPSLWWPFDRLWCIARDVDLMWTYVAGTSELIERLLVSDLPCEEAQWDERIS